MKNIKHIIEKGLNPRLFEVLRTVGEIVGDTKCESTEVYLVGGMLRDLILGHEPQDPDIMVDGSSENFAKILVDHFGGEIVSISQFGTSRVIVSEMEFDIARARKEIYPSPGTLPQIDISCAQKDLARRDFTINAMALSIAPHTWGNLLDPHGGFEDCKHKTLRVLHSKSFIDDPTRIFRAVRYKTRMNLKIESSTKTLLENGFRYLTYVSPARILAEIKKMLYEQKRSRVFRESQNIGLLKALCPSLHISSKALNLMENSGNYPELFYVACISASLSSKQATDFIERIMPNNAWKKIIYGVSNYEKISWSMEHCGLLPSEITELMKNIPDSVLEVQSNINCDNQQRKYLSEYLNKYRFISTELTGDDLIAAGVPEGPLIRTLKNELLNARLDNAIQDRSEELNYVLKRLPILIDGNRLEINDQ